MQQQTPPEPFDLAAMVADLNNLLRLKTTVIGIKMFARVEDMDGDPENPAADRRSTPPTRSSAWPRGWAGPSASPATISSARNAAP